MKDEYLWDRTGEADPDVQQLEDMLGELRYQPRPLEIPAGRRTGRDLSFFPRYAIAAAVATMVLSLGVWLAIQKQTPADITAGNPKAAVPEEVKAKPTQQSDKDDSQRAAAGPIDEKKWSTLSAKNNTGHRSRPRRVVRTPLMTAEEIAEAEMAKDRLMLALRLASSKLNYAQKKTQGSASPVYHQHKIG